MINRAEVEVEVEEEGEAIVGVEARKTIELALRRSRSTTNDWKDTIIVSWAYQEKRDMTSGLH